MRRRGRRYFHFYFVRTPGALEREVGHEEFLSYAGEHAASLIEEARRHGKAVVAVNGMVLRVSVLREAGDPFVQDGLAPERG